MDDRPILYAEDEDDDVFLLRMAFKHTGISSPLQVVSNGQLAMDYLAGTNPYSNRDEYPLPRLVLLDMKMPEKSGLDVLKWMRMTPAFSAIPVIMLTSSSEDGDINRAYLNGANGYLVKPGNLNELQALMKSIKEYWLVHNRVASIPPR